MCVGPGCPHFDPQGQALKVPLTAMFHLFYKMSKPQTQTRESAELLHEPRNPIIAEEPRYCR